MENNEPVKRGPGRPRKNPEPNPLEVIKKPAKANLPTVAEMPEGDNNKFTTFALAIMQLPKIDLRTPGTAAERVQEYFQLCADHDMKPAITGLALALGLDRRRLWEIKTDSQQYQAPLPQENKDAIKQAYDSMEVMWESFMLNGKINPVSGIFLGKNNFGYRDQQEYVLTPNAAGLSNADASTIEAKYAELPEE